MSEQKLIEQPKPPVDENRKPGDLGIVVITAPVVGAPVKRGA